MDRTPLLAVEGLHVRFETRRGTVYAVNGITFDIARGETLGIVGESGCGKSVTSLAILGLLARNGHVESGSATFEGNDLIRQSDRALRGIRGREIAMKLRNTNPNLKVIYTTGYSQDLLEASDEKINFLQKPYPPETLMRTVRACLDAA